MAIEQPKKKAILIQFEDCKNLKKFVNKILFSLPDYYTNMAICLDAHIDCTGNKIGLLYPDYSILELDEMMQNNKIKFTWMNAFDEKVW